MVILEEPHRHFLALLMVLWVKVGIEMLRAWLRAFLASNLLLLAQGD